MVKIFDALDRHIRELQIIHAGDKPLIAEFKELLYCNNQSWKIDINDRSVFSDQKSIENMLANKLIFPDGSMTAKGKRIYKELLSDLRVAMAGLYPGDVMLKDMADVDEVDVSKSDNISKIIENKREKHLNLTEHRSSGGIQSDNENRVKMMGAHIKRPIGPDDGENKSTINHIRMAYVEKNEVRLDDAAQNESNVKEDQFSIEDQDFKTPDNLRGNHPGQIKVSAIDKNMVAILADHSFEAEQFKILRSNILFPHDGKAPRTILVTSAEQGEGKSFVASNLAVSIALSINHHALLIDCDLRNPTVHRMFGFETDWGLSQYLDGSAPLGSLISRTKVDRLSVVPAGRIPLNPSELLSSKKMVALLDEVRNRFSDRIVIIDSPPTELTSEPAVLARNVDGVIITVRYGKTSTRSLKRLIDTIGRDKILGSVLNRFEYAITDYYYGYKSYRKYGAYRKRR